MTKIKEQGKRRGTAQPEPQDRPFAQRAVSAHDLEMALAAGKARQAIDEYAEELEVAELATLTVAYEFFKTYFGERAVRFDGAGAPLLPVGTSGDVDLEWLLESASTEAMTFLDELSEKVEMCFEQERGHFAELGWRHGFIYTSRVGEDPARWLVPVVVTVDLSDMSIVLDKNPYGLLPAPARLVAEQQPKIWERWTKLKATTE